MDFCGHDKQFTLLQRACIKQVPHHVFLFAGPESVGKRTLAESFATALVQDQPLSRAMTYDVNAWRDILVVAPEKEDKKGIATTKDISVKQIRALRKEITLSHTGAKRVIIVDQIEHASVGAQNALLKTLEEPPQDTIIILTTANVERVLPTIVSRGLRVDFGLVSDEELLRIPGSDEVLVGRALGRPGLLSVMISDAEKAEEAQEALALLSQMKTMSLAERISLAEKLAQDPHRLQRTLMLWMWRVRIVAQDTQQHRLLLIADRIASAYDDMQTTAVNKRLRLEELLIHL